MWLLRNEDFDEDAAEEYAKSEEAEEDLMTAMIDAVGFIVCPLLIHGTVTFLSEKCSHITHFVGLTVSLECVCVCVCVCVCLVLP